MDIWTIDKEVKEDRAKMTENISALGPELRSDRLPGLTQNGSKAGGDFSMIQAIRVLSTLDLGALTF